VIPTVEWRFRALSRSSVGAINHALEAGGNVVEYVAAMHRAVADGWLEAHPSGAYVKFTQAGGTSSRNGAEIVSWRVTFSN
jgi:hypothetical protein